jgi:hypothetical protein
MKRTKLPGDATDGSVQLDARPDTPPIPCCRNLFPGLLLHHTLPLPNNVRHLCATSTLLLVLPMSSDGKLRAVR